MRFIFIGILLLTAGIGQSLAQLTESKVQALYVMKFIESTKWSDEKKGIVIGIIGQSDVQTELTNRINFKNPLNIIVKQVSINDANTCDVVFVARNGNGQMSALVQNTGSKSVLIISETNLINKGAAISFHIEDGKVHFIANKEVIKTRGIKISADVLNLGKQV